MSLYFTLRAGKSQTNSSLFYFSAFYAIIRKYYGEGNMYH